MIDQELYSQMHQLLPIACLDLVIIQSGKVLLVKRNKEPAKGQFWLPGGRIFRNETFDDAAKRIALGETGLQINNIKTLGADNIIFDTDPFGHGKGTHTITCVVKCIPATPDVHVDQNHDDFFWWDPRMHHEELSDYVTYWTDTALGF